ncbi:hypothetical protein CKAH01_13370 [Colletotrichum kahawae]|uniref:Uncharacterized protein n=1 Tax=Colletotrichum kahawae TaxID=34407 RepID=A0AAD9YNC9_COLKA|nr:hypothetical protein CKAH01_13370 [Colletotrichum kahawae]
MALLTALLALWMFTALGKHTKPASSQTLPRDQDPALLNPSSLLLGTPKTVTLRFDNKIEEETIAQWRTGRSDLRPYINGVGSLFEQGASRRLVQETQRIFSMQTGWSLSIAIGMVLRAQYKHNRRLK